MEKDDQNNEDNEDTRNYYQVNLNYGDHFVHIPVFSYTGPRYKMYDNVELENMTIQDLKVCVSDVIGEYDSLYYITKDGIKLVNNDSIGELVDRSKLSENVATLYVYHVTPPNVDSDNE
ncbi:hypothetical protein POM88_012633 [Heracleum sosnowskyi]|uniref:Uncharacterized protein n=1 Tax=Heracleum sosnowskyi TaxID=360622 RepID=A0AAD8IWT9_9APIA|nr:hypothetical protein POM88_012633 [Heracleum sosnowskyi]